MGSRGQDQDWVNRFLDGPIYFSLVWMSIILFCIGCQIVFWTHSEAGWQVVRFGAMMFVALAIPVMIIKDTSTMTSTAKSTIVTTVEGGEPTKAFGDFVSKFIVSHPKTSVIITAVVCLTLGFLFHI